MDFEAFATLVKARRTSLLLDAERPVPAALIAELCELAMWAPNHKKTWPWRFANFTGTGRNSIGEAYYEDLVAAGADPRHPKVTKTKGKYARAGAIVAVGSARDFDETLDAENAYAVAAGIEHILLGATAAGLGSFWGSPPILDAPTVTALCGFEKDTKILGLIYLGWPIGEMPAVERPPVIITTVA